MSGRKCGRRDESVERSNHPQRGVGTPCPAEQESVREVFSLPSVAPEPGVAGVRLLRTEFQSANCLPVFPAAVFHSP